MLNRSLYSNKSPNGLKILMKSIQALDIATVDAVVNCHRVDQQGLDAKEKVGLGPRPEPTHFAEWRNSYCVYCNRPT